MVQAIQTILDFLFYKRPAPAQIGEKVQRHAIPSELSLEAILAGKTCPPLHLRDFAGYMTHVAHNVENLQFWMFYHTYVKSFEELPDNLKPAPYIPKDEPFSMAEFEKNIRRGYSWEMEIVDVYEPLTRELTNWSAKTLIPPLPPLPPKSPRRKPLRDELNAAVQLYLLPSSPLELNVPQKMLHKACQAIQKSTHPSGLEEIAKHVYELLGCAHVNFIRYSMCNANKPRSIFALVVGIVSMILAIVFTVLAFFVHGNILILTATFMVLGVATLIANRNGSCIILQLTRRAQLRPWEVEERSLIHRIFDRQAWIEDPHLRGLMDKLLWQALTWSLICTIPVLVLLIIMIN